MDDKYIGLICPHALSNILNVSQRFIKLLYQPKKPHWLFGHFPNIQNGDNEAYDYIDAFLNQLKEYIGEPIAARYVIEITDMTTWDDDNNTVLLPHHPLKHQYYAQWCIERGSIITKNI